MVKEHDLVALTGDLPAAELATGDVGTVVHVHPGGQVFEVEFATVLGQTIIVTTLRETQIRPVSERDMAHARPLT